MPIMIFFLTLIAMGGGGFALTLLFNLSRRIKIVEERQRYLERGEIDRLIALDD